MAHTPCQCPGTAGKACNCPLPANLYKDSHDFCASCYGKSCNANDGCEHCQDWTDEKWERVSAYHEKLVTQWERKACSKSSLL